MSGREIDRQHTELASAEAGINIVGLVYDRALKLLMAAAAFVMLIVCANVANLLLVRALAQSQQTCVRMALGASREQLLQQAMVSSIVLALLGCIGAIGVAYVLSSSVLCAGVSWRRLCAYHSAAFPGHARLCICHGHRHIHPLRRRACVDLDAKQPGQLCCVAPRARHARAALVSQRFLVILQAALSIVLLCAAGLLTRSLTKLQDQDFGFQTRDRYVISIDPALAGYRSAQTNELYQRIEDRLMSIPGAEHVGIAAYAPMSGESRVDFHLFSRPDQSRARQRMGTGGMEPRELRVLRFDRRQSGQGAGLHRCGR